MKRTIFDVTTIRTHKSGEAQLRWEMAKLELRIDELMEALKPFAEAEIESETNGHFAKAKEVYRKYSK